VAVDRTGPWVGVWGWRGRDGRGWKETHPGPGVRRDSRRWVGRGYTGGYATALVKRAGAIGRNNF
jgi:hypothetical protein